jgi:hypothetical protein
MHRAMEYRVLDSEYHPCTFRDQGATELNYTVTNLRFQFREIVSASKGELTLPFD